MDTTSTKTTSQRPGHFLRDADPVAMKDFYELNGYLVLEGAFTPEDVRALNDETLAICRGQRESLRDAPPPPPADWTDAQVLQQYLCIHFPHKLSGLMHDALFNAPTVNALTAIVGPNVKCMQSMLFIKAAGQPGQAWHQDEDFIPTRDRSLIGAWIALDRATTENGCLWVIPGSHRHGILWDQAWHGDRRFDCSEESQGFPYTDADAVPVEVDAGSVVLFNGHLLHRSLPNGAQPGNFRRALVNHFMSSESYLPWYPEGHKPVAKYDYRDVVIVAGTDPFAHRGYADIAKPHVRKDGKTGCVSWSTDQHVFLYPDEANGGPLVIERPAD